MRALLALTLLCSGAALADPAGDEPADPADERPQEPDDPAEADDPEDPALEDDAATGELTLQLQGCRDLVRRGDLPAARVCYETPSAGSSSEERRVRERVGLALSDLSAPPEPEGGLERLGAFVTSGKAELVAASTLFGGYLGELALLNAGFLVFPALGFAPPLELQPLLAASVFLAPLAGGALGLGAAAVAVALLPAMTSGDANLLRTSLFLAAFNGGVTGILVDSYGRRGALDWWRLGGVITTSAMLAASFGTAGAGGALAVLADLPEGAGPLALSAGTWAGVLCVLAQLMFELPLDFEPGTLAVAATVNASFLAGLAVSPWVPVTRFETWLLDLGAIAGGLVATALVLGLPAPNPVLGYGGIAAGLVLGGGAGLGVGKLVPSALELVELPTLVAIAPLALPPALPGDLPVGVALALDLEGLLAAD